MQSSSQRCDWPHQFGYFIKEPIDVVLAITSSNDPLNPNAHKVGPAIAAGCACILKPAMQTPFAAMALAKCLFEAGLSAQCLQIVNGDEILPLAGWNFDAVNGSFVVTAAIAALTVHNALVS